jgi:hypothetical protein
VDAIIREKLHSGTILTITGGLSRIRLSMPTGHEAGVGDAPGFKEFEGPAEAQGNGYFGWTTDTYVNEKSGIVHRAGEPFLQCHMTVNAGDGTHLGHLIEGCKVRSLHPKSHFIAILAEAVGVELTLRSSEDRTPAYPNGLPYYDLKSTVRA